jgi:DNA polymerase III alpha subunit (gram-positive type)
MSDKLLRFDKEKEIVLFDFESYNLFLNPQNNKAWELAMMRVKGDKIIDQKSWILLWDYGENLKCGDGARFITGYTEEREANEGIPAEQVFPTIMEWMDNADILMGHNILGFDMYLTRWIYRHFGKSWRHLIPKCIDTNCLAKGIALDIQPSEGEDLFTYQMKLYHKRQKGLKTGIDALLKQLNIEFDASRRHQALYDIELNKMIWDRLKYNIEI